MREQRQRSIFISSAFWLSVLDRALRTFAQAALATIGTTAVALDDVSWGIVASSGALAAVMSVLMSVVSAGIDPSTGASTGTELPAQDA